jgi:hypothetical protein
VLGSGGGPRGWFFFARISARVMTGVAMAEGRSQNARVGRRSRRVVRGRCGPFVHVERGQHGSVGDAHPGDVASVAGARDQRTDPLAARKRPEQNGQSNLNRT